MRELNGHQLEVSTVRGLIQARAELGERKFATIGEQSLTYGEAAESANRIANSLRELGVEKGDVIATYMRNSVDHIRVWFACAKLGAIWTPMSAALVDLDLRYTVENAQPRAVVVDAELLDGYLAVHERLRSAPTLIIRGEGQAPDGSIGLPELLRGSPAEPPGVVHPSDPAAIIYTGGSTGMPKGVLVSNMWYFPGVLRYGEMFEPTEADVHMGLGQMCHTIGSAVDVLAPWYFGMQTSLFVRFSASGFWAEVKRRQATITVMIGPLMDFLLRQPESLDDLTNTIRIAGSATGQISRDIPDRFAARFGITLLEVYGQTETGPLGCFGQRLDDRPYHSVGRSHGWVDVEIHDEEGCPAPVGVGGEIVLRPRSPGSFLTAYHGQPEKFVEACKDLWFHTGDIGHLDEAGYLHFDGRKAHAIRRRGENVAAIEVEAAILLHQAVAECAVVGVPSEYGEEEIKAFVVLEEGMALEPEALVEFLEARIARFKVPRYVAFAEDLPRSSTKNEIERYKLREPGVDGAWDREAALAARPPPARRRS